MDNSVTPSAVLLRDRQPDHEDTRSPPRPAWEPSLEWLSLLPHANLPSPFLLFPSSFPNQLPLCQLLSQALFWGDPKPNPSSPSSLLSLQLSSHLASPLLFAGLLASSQHTFSSPVQLRDRCLDRVWVTKSDVLSHTIPWKLWLYTKVGGGQQG